MATTSFTATARLRPVWLSEVPPAACGALKQDLVTEVCIIGGGVAALTTAWLLLQAGKQVDVLLPTDLRSGVASQSSAHLASTLPIRYHQIESLLGPAGARQIAESQLAGIELLDQICTSLRLDCGFTRLNGYLMAPPGESLRELEREYAAVQRAGISRACWVDSVPIAGFPSGRCIQLPAQAQFHPLRYISQLAARIVSAGGRIFGQTAVAAITPGDHPVVRTVSAHQVHCDVVVWADDVPVATVLEGATTGSSQVFDHHVIAARIPAQEMAPLLLWDTATPDHHARLADLGGDGITTPQHVLIVSTRQPHYENASPREQRFQLLELWAQERFPMIERIEYRWNYQATTASDGLADIGRLATGAGQIYLGADDAGNSLTNGLVAPLINSSLILGRHQPWAPLYAPNRQVMREAAARAAESPVVAWQSTGSQSASNKRESSSLPAPRSARHT